MKTAWWNVHSDNENEWNTKFWCCSWVISTAPNSFIIKNTPFLFIQKVSKASNARKLVWIYVKCQYPMTKSFLLSLFSETRCMVLFNIIVSIESTELFACFVCNQNPFCCLIQNVQRPFTGEFQKPKVVSAWSVHEIMSTHF